jgi:predicted MPP superfamily phosphohydrolase
MKESKRFMIYKIVILIILIGIACLAWARYISTRGLVIKEYPIKTNKLDEDYDGFKIVQFTDVHYGSTVGIEEIKKIVKRINDQNPDVVVFTGDLFESGIQISDENVLELTKELNNITASIQVFGVAGNHDYDNKHYWELFVENTNWKILTNTFEFVYSKSDKPIVFVGVDDYWVGDPVYKDAYQWLNDNTKDYYTVLLLHEPDQVEHLNDFTEDTNYTFDIALAGHSHLGQVRLPFIGALWTPYGSKKYYDEHYVLDNKDLYISGGLGTSSLKLRFFNKPSINIYRFYTK